METIMKIEKTNTAYALEEVYLLPMSKETMNLLRDVTRKMIAEPTRYANQLNWLPKEFLCLMNRMSKEISESELIDISNLDNKDNQGNNHEIDISNLNNHNHQRKDHDIDYER